MKPLGVATRSPTLKREGDLPLISSMRSGFHIQSLLCIAADGRAGGQIEQLVTHDRRFNTTA
jgi:hypothetical protein